MLGSSYTRVTRRKLWLYRILNWLLLFLPVIIYVGIALSDDNIEAVKKITLSATVVIALILTVVNFIGQKKLRCPIWIILIGLVVAIQKYLLPLIIILAITSVLDDLFFAPIISYYRAKLIANKAIDEREGE